MKPEKYRLRGRAAAVARGRMYLKAKLAWLPGFPVGQELGVVQWMTLPRHGEQPPATLLLDRNHLHRATLTWHKLIYHFPHALPFIVEEPAPWQRGVPQLLEWLKRAIHQGEAYPVSLFGLEDSYDRSVVLAATHLGADQPALQPVLAALSWTTYLTPTELPQALKWLAANCAALTVLLQKQPGAAGVVMTLTLWQLARRDGEQRVAPLVALLGDTRLYTLPMADLRSFLERWAATIRDAKKFQAKSELPVRPTTQAAPFLVDFVNQLAWQPKGVRRRTLDLFPLLWPDELLAQCQAWWAMAEPLLVQSRRVVAVAQAQQHKLRHAQQIPALVDLEQQLTALSELLPPITKLQRLLTQIQQLSADDAIALYHEVLPTLPLLPAVQSGALVRGAFCAHWLGVAARFPTALPPFVREFRQFLQINADLPRRLEPWQRVINFWAKELAHHDHWNTTVTILSELSDQRMWPRCFETLAACLATYRDTVDEENIEWLIKLIRLLPTTTAVVEAFPVLTQEATQGIFYDEALLTCALRLAADSAQLSAIAPALQKLADQNHFAINAVKASIDWLQPTPWAASATTLLLAGEQTALIQLGQKLLTLHALGQRVDPPGQKLPVTSPYWLAHYPTALHPVLTALAAIAPAAEEIADRLLGQSFPAPAKLQTEIDTIARLLLERPADHHLLQRYEKLRQRLQAPLPVSPQRLQRLQEKVAHAYQYALLQQWQSLLTTALTNQLRTILAVDELPDWVFEPRHLSVIAALTQLTGAVRTLGLRLLRRRCGPPPWTLLDDPANQAYLTRLRQAGIDPTPWLATASPQPHTGKNGRQIWVNFEADPLEIFQMGAHFKTCLSPGNFNFFSVFANAADCNKRVVYARDAAGQVVGRCLLALTDSGHLLTFEPYCHDPALGFDEIMGRIATAMAERMGTLVAERGSVPTLVAPRWYDDGPRDLCGAFAFLQWNSAFRQTLAELPVEAFVPALESAFAPLPLNALTLLPVLELYELRERPALLLPLLPYIEQSQGIPDATLFNVAVIAHAAGEERFVRNLLRAKALPYLLSLHRRNLYVDEYLALLVAVEPSLALRFLRQTRPTGVRQDEDETDVDRLTSLAQAHEALGRSVRAARLRAQIEAKA